MCRSPVALRGLPAIAAALACVGAVLLPAAAVEPFTRVYDAPAATAAALSDETLARRPGWRTVREDDTTHRFKGCAVLANDKLAAVFHAGEPHVNLYSRQTRPLKLCARLQPIHPRAASLRVSGLALTENTRNSASVKVTLRPPAGTPCHVTCQLNLGEPFVRTTAAGLAKLRVRAPCRFAVMPDFFADDILIDAATIGVARAELPSENFLLHMMHGGQAILLTVSQSRDTDVAITLSKAAPWEIEASDVSYGKKPRLWVAVLAGEGIWHERTIGPDDAGKVLKLDWHMPFPALWRVDWTAADQLNESWEMLLQHPEGKYVQQRWFGADPAAGQSFGPEFGPRDWNKPGRKRWNPVLGAFAYPCWVDKDRQGYLQPLTKRRYVERGEVCNFAGPAIVYPLDRVKAAPFRTPAERLTLVDLVRMTLGVGPCEYILDLEGQRRDSEGVATCYARDVITAIYKEGTQLRSEKVIVKQLAAAVAFIRNVRKRIDDYVAFGRETRAYLQQQKRRHPEHARFLDEMLAITSRLDAFYQSRKEGIHTPEYAEKAAADFRRDLLKHTGADAYEKCRKHMAIFTSIGGRQDGLVASCRMIVKVLRQRVGIAMAVSPELKDIAAALRARTRKVLRNPTAYEAPQH